MRVSKKSSGRIICGAALSAIPIASASAQVTIYDGPAFVGGAGGSGGTQANVATPVPKYSQSSTAGTSVTSGADIFSGYNYYPASTNTNAPNVDSSDAESSVINTTGSSPVLLQPLANNPRVIANTNQPNPTPGGSTAYAINGTAGIAVGSAPASYTSSGSFTQTSAAWWNTTNGAVTAYPEFNPTYSPAVNALSTLGYNSANGTISSSEFVYAVNSSGVAAGNATFYNTSASTPTSVGTRPVVWLSTSSAPTPLALDGTASTGTTNGSAVDISNNGDIVGTVYDYTTSPGNYSGSRAAVWLPGSYGTSVTLLPSLKSTSQSDTASVVNASGIVGGISYDASNNQFAMRWTSPTTYDQLHGVGLSSTGTTGSNAIYGINDQGDVVGQGYTYAPSTGGGTGPTGTTIAAYAYLGTRPELWKFGTTTPTVLQVDGTTTTGSTTGAAYDINDAEYSVGTIKVYNSTGTQGTETSAAALWDPNGNFTDLTTLLAPSQLATATTGGWVYLQEADAITNDGWISGFGVYDPDGTSNPEPSYQRAFLIQDTAAVPEPTSIALVAVGALAGLRRRSVRIVP